MRMARKLQLAYMIILLIPVITIVSLVAASYYASPNSLGPYADLDAPGWIKAELAAILEEDWEAYSSLNEAVVIFLMDSKGFIRFPNIVLEGGFPARSPDLDFDDFTANPNHPEDLPPIPGEVPLFLTDIFNRYGTGWTLDVTMTPFTANGEKFLVAWRMPRFGIPGFIARRGWFVPILILTAMMIIPAFINTRLRHSIQRLQQATSRLSDGNLDEPIPVLFRDDLAELAESLEKTRVELKNSRDQKSRILMAVSHDLRTPLTSIKGYIEAIGDGMAENPEDFKKYLAVLSSKAALLESRIGELIDFARAQTGGWKKPEARIDAGEFFNRLDAAFRQDCGFSGMAYSSVIEIPDNIVMTGDAAAFYRAWENLFTNAQRHGIPSDGRVASIEFRVGLDVENSSESDLWLFGEVLDTGDGVPAEFVPLLFEPFTRADKGRNARGIGLGLASVKAVASAYGGEVHYRPNEGGGAVFRIRIPCRAEPAKTPE